MKTIYGLVFIAFLIASCSSAPSGNAIQTAIVQTEMARPTKTFVFNLTAIPTPLPPTPIPLANLDLASIHIKPGDLPTGLVGGQVQDFLPGMFTGIPQPVNQIYQLFDQINQINGSGGGVSVIVYDSAASSIEAYDIILSDMGGKVQEKDIENLGEQAQISGWNLLFLRCNTIVHFRMVCTNYDDYISYAQRLDERLIPLVCW